MAATTVTFSQFFNLNKSQYEIDFVDIPVNKADIPLFIDPYAISQRIDYWSVECHAAIVDFFQGLISEIAIGKKPEAMYRLSGLREPNQTRFGLSTGNKPRGRGVGTDQAGDLYAALAGSTAVQTGFIRDLEECELMVERIGRDKISDITTNIIRHKLIEYTQNQCVLHGVPMQPVSSEMVWDAQNSRWTNTYVDLPVCRGRSVLLVPKAIARVDIAFDHQDYYQHFVLNYLQAEYLSHSSLVRTLKDGTKKGPTKKTLKERHPLSKKFLYEFSKEHPEILEKYKNSKGYTFKEISPEELMHLALMVGYFEEGHKFNFPDLIQKFDGIPSGRESADDYHNHIMGALTAIFYPVLTNPKKEQSIHDDRKKIDISFQNSAKMGFFSELPNNKGVPSGFVFAECKNYSSDPVNPELDQLSGRFSTNRGRFGFLVCRKFKNKALFIQRCKDTAQDGRGFIITLDDDDIKLLLTLRSKHDYQGIDNFLNDRFKQLVM